MDTKKTQSANIRLNFTIFDSSVEWMKSMYTVVTAVSDLEKDRNICSRIKRLFPNCSNRPVLYLTNKFVNDMSA